jgi:hypothetical protein
MAAHNCDCGKDHLDNPFSVPDLPDTEEQTEKLMEAAPVKKLTLKFEGVWGDGFIPFAVLWGGDGVGICIFSYVIGVKWE